ncbi:MAG: hypothetical protein K2L49_08945 [Muribaculaceae bacterium]|nr:hypothetical protein [Muribaculaceae bacterium]
MWFHSVEFYVIAAVVAAAVIALAARPSQRGTARTWLLYPDPIPGNHEDTPALTVECDDSGDVVVTRSGLPQGIGSVSLSVTLIGRDLSIEEQLIPASISVDPMAGAVVRLDFFGRERYHLSYSSPSQSLFVAMDFTVRPGMRVVKPFILS